MSLYVISYDQHRDRDYTAVWTQLRQWGAARILESVWLLDSSQTATSIRERLQTVTRQEDSLFVIQVSANAQWGTFNVQASGLDWLQKHIP
jgi:CRISPR/Cas system-associated endoribonuclease Cas2